jgi:hypothetical protein
MSREELITTYREGGMSRRTLIRRLAASGVSLGAAISYAHLFAPKAEADERRNHADYYEDYYTTDVRLRIVSNTVNGVVRTGTVNVFIHTDDGAEITLKVFTKIRGRLRRIGIKTITTTQATSRLVQIPIGDGALRLLRQRDRKWIKVTSAATDESGTSYARTSKTLDDAS